MRFQFVSSSFFQFSISIFSFIALRLWRAKPSNTNNVDFSCYSKNETTQMVTRKKKVFCFLFSLWSAENIRWGRSGRGGKGEREIWGELRDKWNRSQIKMVKLFQSVPQTQQKDCILINNCVFVCMCVCVWECLLLPCNFFCSFVYSIKKSLCTFTLLVCLLFVASFLRFKCLIRKHVAANQKKVMEIR